MNTFMAKVYATNPSSTRNQWRKLMVCRVGKMMPPNEAQTKAIASQSKYWTPIFFPTCRVSFDSLSLFLSVSTTTNHSYFRSLFLSSLVFFSIDSIVLTFYSSKKCVFFLLFHWNVWTLTGWKPIPHLIHVRHNVTNGSTQFTDALLYF